MKQKKMAYYGKKILIFIFSVLILSITVFYVARLAPGDPLVSYYGERSEKMSPEGDKVTANGSLTCGVCEACRSGRYNICQKLGFLGVGL